MSLGNKIRYHSSLSTYSEEWKQRKEKESELYSSGNCIINAAAMLWNAKNAPKTEEIFEGNRAISDENIFTSKKLISSTFQSLCLTTKGVKNGMLTR